MITIHTLADLALAARNEVVVGTLDKYVARRIGASTCDVMLSCETLSHNRAQHPGLTAGEYLLIPTALERGLVIHETARPYSASIAFQGKEEGKRYAIGLRVTQQGHEIWIRSFHLMRKRQTKSMLNRGYTLRSHK